MAGTLGSFGMSRRNVDGILVRTGNVFGETSEIFGNFLERLWRDFAYFAAGVRTLFVGIVY